MSFLSCAFGKIIKERRLELGISQAVLAEKVDVNPATVSNWETGNYLPTDDKIDKIGEILGIDGKDVFDPNRAELIRLIRILKPSMIKTVTDVVSGLVGSDENQSDLRKRS